MLHSSLLSEVRALSSLYLRVSLYVGRICSNTTVLSKLKMKYVSFLFSFIAASATVSVVHSFAPVVRISGKSATIESKYAPMAQSSRTFYILNAQGEDDTEITSMSESDQSLLGVTGTVAGLVTLYSESVLKTTGCGLPAGPFGLVGAIEGVSYLGIVGIAAYSLYTKIKTGSGLPAGPSGLLGAAEGLSYLSIVAGLVVLVFQVLNYGYIPNAVPMEGAMCS
jgi:hypothetical protein